MERSSSRRMPRRVIAALATAVLVLGGLRGRYGACRHGRQHLHRLPRKAGVGLQRGDRDEPASRVLRERPRSAGTRRARPARTGRTARTELQVHPDGRSSRPDGRWPRVEGSLRPGRRLRGQRRGRERRFCLRRHRPRSGHRDATGRRASTNAPSPRSGTDRRTRPTGRCSRAQALRVARALRARMVMTASPRTRSGSTTELRHGAGLPEFTQRSPGPPGSSGPVSRTSTISRGSPAERRSAVHVTHDPSGLVTLVARLPSAQPRPPHLYDQTASLRLLLLRERNRHGKPSTACRDDRRANVSGGTAHTCDVN